MDIDTPFPVKGTVTIQPDYTYHSIPCEDEWLTEGVNDYLQAAKERVKKEYDVGEEIRVIWHGSHGECTGYAVVGPVGEL